MPGSNAGTGQPICYLCPKCRAKPGGERGRRWSPTGQVKPLSRSQKRCGGRTVNFRMQVVCLECGHLGWSRHIDVARRLQRDFISVTVDTDRFQAVSRDIDSGLREYSKKTAA